LKTEFYNDGTENNSQILTRLTNIANDINGITFSDTSAKKLYAIGKIPLSLVKKKGSKAETLFAKGIQLFNLPKEAQALYGRFNNVKSNFVLTLTSGSDSETDTELMKHSSRHRLLFHQNC
jgi:hypothetical protein